MSNNLYVIDEEGIGRILSINEIITFMTEKKIKRIMPGRIKPIDKNLLKKIIELLKKGETCQYYLHYDNAGVSKNKPHSGFEYKYECPSEIKSKIIEIINRYMRRPHGAEPRYYVTVTFAVIFVNDKSFKISYGSSAFNRPDSPWISHGEIICNIEKGCWRAYQEGRTPELFFEDYYTAVTALGLDYYEEIVESIDEELGDLDREYAECEEECGEPPDEDADEMRKLYYWNCIDSCRIGYRRTSKLVWKRYNFAKSVLREHGIQAGERNDP